MSEAVVRSPSQLRAAKEAYINFTLARLERDYRLNGHCEGIGVVGNLWRLICRNTAAL